VGLHDHHYYPSDDDHGDDNNNAPYVPPPAIPMHHHKPVLRALSAYNFFFRDERDRIVDHDATNDGAANERPYDTSHSKKDRLLAGHWHRDRSVKRRHRKTHGKIAFTDLSKVISKRWRELPNPVKAFYRDVAADDLVRYHSELEAQKASFRQHTPPPPPPLSSASSSTNSPPAA
jgi:hypothetical protein